MIRRIDHVVGFVKKQRGQSLHILGRNIHFDSGIIVSRIESSLESDVVIVPIALLNYFYF